MSNAEKDLQALLETERFAKARFAAARESLQEIFGWIREVEIQTLTEISARRAQIERESGQTAGRESSGEPAPALYSVT